MDRMTGRHPSGLVYVPQGMMPEALDLLAAYEDTGLTPEEIGEMKTAYDENQMPYAIEATGSEAVHIYNLLLAEAQGRLVVLPCKIDDPVYLIRGEKEPRKQMKFWVEKYDIDHFTIGGAMIPMITACSKENEWEELIDGTQKGHEYFLTREEAEAALKGETDNG